MFGEISKSKFFFFLPSHVVAQELGRERQNIYCVRKEDKMTQNQIAFQRHLEEKRHNLAVEQETNRYNVSSLAETATHNRATEANQRDANVINAQHFIRSDFENARHNTATERNEQFKAQEQARHNRESESVQWYTAGEQRRHNMQQESIGYLNAAASLQSSHAALSQADVAQQRAEIERGSLDVRRQEAQTNRINSQTRQREVEARVAELAIKQQSADAATANAAAAARNAATNYYSAATQRNVARSQYEKNLADASYSRNKIAVDWVNAIVGRRGVVGTVTDLFQFADGLRKENNDGEEK